SVRFQTALASIKLIQASAVLDLTEDDFDFLTSNKVWIATDRSRARRCVEACVYGTLDFVGYPRFQIGRASCRERVYMSLVGELWVYMKIGAQRGNHIQKRVTRSI